MNLNELPASRIQAVFTDLDDTLTENGTISSDTFHMLWKLKERGFWLVVVSGRSAGWADALMRLWPIDHMIFENGAGIMVREGKRLVIQTLANETDLAAQKRKLQSIFEKLKKEVPELKCATDQFCRLFDYTIDYREEPPYLEMPIVEDLMSRLSKEPGITAKLSSIHINFWCGTHTKVTACLKLISKEGRKIDRDRIVFVGDSPNDEPLFEFFPNAVGVANIAPFLGTMKWRPQFITELPWGKGFEQVGHRLLEPK